MSHGGSDGVTGRMQWNLKRRERDDSRLRRRWWLDFWRWERLGFILNRRSWIGTLGFCRMEVMSSAVSLSLRKWRGGAPDSAQRLHPNSLDYLLALFNPILLQGTNPLSWKLAIILHIPKPLKVTALRDSYPAIALTSVLGKLFQKIINKRLTWYLESNNILSHSQYSFRKGRNTP